MKAKIFAANWKLHKTPRETEEFFTQWKEQCKGSEGCEIVFFPSAFCMESTARSLAKTDFGFGAQNCFYEPKGAFTGENSVSTLKQMGGRYVLIGHSERRQLFCEDDQTLQKKLAFVQSQDLVPVFCIGESLQDREAQRTTEVLKSQLQKGLASADSAKALIVAYEPVWAIGTGRVANTEQVQEAHTFIRKVLAEQGFAKTPILYGGSVKADNAKDLIAIEHVDGFLVGGASLEVDSFLAITTA